MRAVDDSRPTYAAILRVLQIWKELPESDVVRLLHGSFLITDDFRGMEDQGLITMMFIGDEYMIAPTMLGRIWLEQHDNPEEQKNDTRV